MKRITGSLTFALVAGPSVASALAGPTEVTWQDLVPPSAEIANRFETLTSDQLEALRRIRRLEREDEPEKRAYAQRKIHELAQMDDPQKRAEADELRKCANLRGSS